MYQKILIPLDATDADRTILDHIKPLAKLFHSSVTFLHVADGWAARTYGDNAVSPEIAADQAYLAKIKSEFEAEGISSDAQLAFGSPPAEIVKWVKDRGCDLVAMSTHGHRFLADLLHGTTAHRVQHEVDVPVLLVKVKS